MMATEVMQSQLEQDNVGIRDDNHRLAQYMEVTRRIRDSNMTLEKEIGIYQATTSSQIKEVSALIHFRFTISEHSTYVHFNVLCYLYCRYRTSTLRRSSWLTGSRS